MTEQDRKLASRAYLFYLLNITFLPGLGFLLQILLWHQTRSLCLAFASAHARQSVLASITAGVLLTAVTGLILFIGSWTSPYTWVVLILYFTLCHTTLILLGVVAYARSNGGKTFSPFHVKTWWAE